MKKLMVNVQVRFMVILLSLYACILAAAFVLFPDNLAFKGPNPNPYFIMALIFAAFYGIVEAAPLAWWPIFSFFSSSTSKQIMKQLKPSSNLIL